MSFPDEIRSMFRLAWPLAVAEAGWVTMNFVDLAFMGHVGSSAMAAIALGNALFIAIVIIAIGSLLSLDALVSQAYGAGRIEDCHRYLWASQAYCLPVSAILIVFLYAIKPLLFRAGYSPDVTEQMSEYLRALSWGIPPLLCFAAMRRYVQALHQVGIITFAMISANLVNAFFDYVFIYGHFGSAALGARGSGYATTVARLYMFAVLATYVLWNSRHHGYRIFAYTRSFFEWPRVRQILRIGLPAAGQIALEVGIFSTSTLIAGRLGAQPVAAHQIALEMASFAYMVPLGISAATAVRVGHAIGRRDPAAATLSGWTGGALALCWMTFTALAFCLLPHQLAAIFTNDPVIRSTAVQLLYIAAIFQLFDGLQVVMIGALRGTAETRTAMLLNIVGWWMLTLPVSLMLCFHFGKGVRGIWIGFCYGEVLIASSLAFAWHRRMQRLSREGISDSIAHAVEAAVAE